MAVDITLILNREVVNGPGPSRIAAGLKLAAAQWRALVERADAVTAVGNATSGIQLFRSNKVKVWKSYRRPTHPDRLEDVPFATGNSSSNNRRHNNSLRRSNRRDDPWQLICRMDTKCARLGRVKCTFITWRQVLARGMIREYRETSVIFPCPVPCPPAGKCVILHRAGFILWTTIIGQHNLPTLACLRDWPCRISSSILHLFFVINYKRKLKVHLFYFPVSIGLTTEHPPHHLILPRLFHLQTLSPYPKMAPARPLWLIRPHLHRLLLRYRMRSKKRPCRAINATWSPKLRFFGRNYRRCNHNLVTAVSKFLELKYLRFALPSYIEFTEQFE